MIRLLKEAIKHILLLLIGVYQYCISPFLQPRCRFLPTCSQYSKEAIMKHGVIKGFLLSLKRILRCNPFSEGGVDEVK